MKGMAMKREKTGDETAAYEKAIEGMAQNAGQRYVLRLYVAGATPVSVRAIDNIRKICEEQLRDRYDLEVIDIYQHADQLKKAEIVVAPTLVKSLPEPVRKLIGDLSDKERVLIGLDIVPRDNP
jgi:circadian clock protein KaiB